MDDELRTLLKELFKRWDGLGNNKDDDFGEVQEVMEKIRPLVTAEGTQDDQKER